MRTARFSTRTIASFIGALVGLVGYAPPARADRSDPPSDEAPPETVRIQGDRGRSGARGFVSTARMEDSPREITDAASLVEPLPGVHVRRLGADDSFATLSIRGSSSTQVAVYLAGVPLSGGADPTLDLATLPLWPGARADVYRSFAPAALGRGSLGGTLVLSPPSPRAPAKTEIWTASGSFGALRLRIGDVRGDENGVRIATGFSASRSDDDFTYLDPKATIAQGEDVFATRVNAGHAAAAGMASVGMPIVLGDGTRGALTVTALAQARRQQLPGPLYDLTPYQQLDSSRLVSALELTVPAGGGALGLRGWGRREGLSLRDSPARVTIGEPTRTDDAIVAAGGSFGWRGAPGPATIEARVDGSAERYAPGSWQGIEQPPAARRTNGGLALDTTLRATRALTLAASGRTDGWVDASEDGTNKGYVKPTGNLGVELDLELLTLAAHGGAVARPPSFVERYGNRGAFIGDPNLLPESAYTVDAGAKTTTLIGGARGLALYAEVVGFATWADDLIVLVNQGAYLRAKATNIGRARLAGLETALRLGYWQLELRASHTALMTANEDLCAGNTGTCERPPLPGRPTHDFVGDLTWLVGSRGRRPDDHTVEVRYGVDVVSGIRPDLTGQIDVPGRVLHGATARWAFPGIRGLSFAFDIRNIFDLRVAEYRGSTGPVRYPIGDLFQYPLPGRRVLLSARLVWP